jgi:hypothetical protein
VLVVRVVPHDVRAAVAPRRHGDDTGALRPDESRPQAEAEPEVPEVVGGEVGLMAVRVARQRRRHHAGAVDEDVQRPAGGDEPLRERVDRLGVEQVHRCDLDAFDVMRPVIAKRRSLR